MKADTNPRGLLIPAWCNNGERHKAKVVFSSGPFEGMTVAEVAYKLRVRAESVRMYAEQGRCPTQLTPRGKPGDGIRRMQG